MLPTDIVFMSDGSSVWAAKWQLLFSFAVYLKMDDFIANLVSMAVFFSSNLVWDETELFSLQQLQHQQNLKSLNVVMGYTREEESWWAWKWQV